VSDIDLLIIYTEPQHPKLIRAYFQKTELKLPLHITFLTNEEEVEFDFINSVNAKKIFS
jgi:predicted nucleotidyltransferase